MPCDYSSSSEIDELHGRAASHYLPQDATNDAEYQAFSWHVHEHPMLRRVRRTGHGGPHRLSDVASQRQWHGLGLYNEFFRWTHVEHQVAFTANDPRAPAATAIAFNRSSHDFDDRDMAVFRAARPRLARVQPSGSGLTVVGPVGHVESLTGSLPRLRPWPSVLRSSRAACSPRICCTGWPDPRPPTSSPLPGARS